MILDGGECQIGLESTIVAVTGEQVRLLRPGSVTATQLREVVGELALGPGVTRCTDACRASSLPRLAE